MGQVSIKLDNKTSARLEEASRASGNSLDELARRAIDEFLDEHEALKSASIRMKEIQSGQTVAISHEEAMRKLGLAD